MSFNQLLPYIIVSIIWLSMSVISIIVYFLFPPELYYWDKVYDKCNGNSFKYRYIVRFIFGSFKKDFNISKTSISIEVMSAKKPFSLTRLILTPKQLEKSLPKFEASNLKVCHFLLHRTEPLLGIDYIVVNHNGIGSLNVTTFEVQDVNSKLANISYIGQPISGLDKSKASVTQRFPSATKEERNIESALRSTQTLTAFEYIIHFFLAINVMILMSVLVIPCDDKESKLCTDYRSGFLSSVLTALSSCTTGAVILVVFCCIYRYLIKRSLFKASGQGFCVIVRIGYLILSVLLGAVCGGIAVTMAANDNRLPDTNPKQDYNHKIYWMFGVGIGIAVFFMFWVSILSVIAYLIGFLSEPEDLRGSTIGPTFKSTEQTTRSNGTIEDENSSDYYNTLMKGNTKVKSISQYAGVGAATKEVQKSGTASAPAAPMEKSKIDKKKSKVQKTASTESTGSGYFQQLMKGKGKVKSVSQYQGVGK